MPRGKNFEVTHMGSRDYTGEEYINLFHDGCCGSVEEMMDELNISGIDIKGLITKVEALIAAERQGQNGK